MPDLNDILGTLAQAPSLIEQAANEVAAKKASLDSAKRGVERARALATIKRKDDKNQMLMKANVEIDPVVDRMEAAVITATSDWMIAVSKWERQKNEFDAARKEANLIETEMRLTGSSQQQ